jgi:hypothetical protein
MPDVAAVAESIISWAATNKVKVHYTTAPDLDSAMGRRVLGVHAHKIFTLQTNGMVWILSRELASKFPSKGQEGKKLVLAEFERRLSAVAGGTSTPGQYGTQAAWRLEHLDSVAFFETLDWLLEQLQTGYAAVLRRI